MPFGKAHTRGKIVAEINVTPLVDVMLVLLVIFMVTAPILQQGVAVDLPEARAGALAGKDEQLVVSVTKKGTLYLNDDALSSAELESKLRAIAAQRPDGQVFVRADKTVPYGDVVAVMAAIKEAGIRRVGMVTALPPGEE